MGFEQVFDYGDGKRDWGSFGLRREGTMAEKPSAGDVADATFLPANSTAT